MIEFAGIGREHAELADVLHREATAVLASGQMLQGPQVTALEAALASACGRREAICVGSGTDALFFALTALGIGPGTEVLVPDVSFIATASAVARCGATPVFVDVDDACLIDLKRAAEAVTPKTRAILLVQLFGAMADPAAVRAFASAHGLFVVEDAAQAFGARYGSVAAGAAGDVSALSFDPMKVLSAPGSGGAVLTDDSDAAAQVRRLRYHGRQDGAYLELGYNSQLSTLAAAVLLVKLKHQTVWAERRRAVAARFINGIAHLPLERPLVRPDVHHAWHKFVLRTPRRDALMQHLKTLGVPTLVHYPRPFHREPMFGGRSAALFPTAERHATSTLSLPIHAHLRPDEVEHIIASVESFFA